MGALRRIMITGAGGFIGQATVRTALARGQEVVAVVRGSVPAAWRGENRIAVMRCDLSDPNAADDLAEAMQVDAVIHAAAHVGAAATAHDRDSVDATQTLLHALTISGVKRLVLVSSIAVYDTAALSSGATVTEATPLESLDTPRDDYVRGKLAQELLCQKAADRRALSLAVMRPGAVYGPGRTWNAHMGVGLGPLLIRTGANRGQVPLCHIDRCAEALVAAALGDAEGAFNVLDDDLPDRRRFLRAHRASGWPKITVPLPWRLLQVAGWLRDYLPGKPAGLLRTPVLKARMMALDYPNTRLRGAFRLPDTGAFEVLMAETLKAGRND